MSDLTSISLNDEYIEILKSLPNNDERGRRDSSQALANSTAVYHNEITHFLAAPKMYAPREINFFERTVETMYAILAKVTQRYIDDPAYRKLFGFPKELEELILLDPGYPCPIPIMRMDIFLHEDDLSFKFCELNTDGTSAMNEDREITSALELAPAFKLMAERHMLEPFELFDSWIDEFERIYASYCDAVEDPFVAIADFMEETTPEEIEHFEQRFRARGHKAAVVEIRDLKYRDGSLFTPAGDCIDAIYRRAVTTDIMSHFDEIGDFLQAVRDGAVCLVGSFRTQVVHAKIGFEVLHRAETAAFLTPEEIEFIAAHVPYTAHLTKDFVAQSDAGVRVPASTSRGMLPVDVGPGTRQAALGEDVGNDAPWHELGSVLGNKDNWIIKPLDGYAAQGVHAGVDCTQDEWEQIIKDRMRESEHQSDGSIIQEYYAQFETINLDPGYHMEQNQPVTPFAQTPDFANYKNLTGLYTYGGRFAGVLARAGQKGTICSAAGGYTLGVFKAE